MGVKLLYNINIITFNTYARIIFWIITDQIAGFYIYITYYNSYIYKCVTAFLVNSWKFIHTIQNYVVSIFIFKVTIASGGKRKKNLIKWKNFGLNNWIIDFDVTSKAHYAPSGLRLSGNLGAVTPEKRKAN